MGLGGGGGRVFSFRLSAFSFQFSAFSFRLSVFLGGRLRGETVSEVGCVLPARNGMPVACLWGYPMVNGSCVSNAVFLGPSTR